MSARQIQQALRDIHEGKLPEGARRHAHFLGWILLPNGVEVRWVPAFPKGHWDLLGPSGQEIPGASPTTLVEAGRHILVLAGYHSR